MKPKFYGNSEEIVVEIQGFYFLIDSPHLAHGDWEETSGIPEGFYLISDAAAKDIAIPEEILEILAHG